MSQNSWIRKEVSHDTHGEWANVMASTRGNVGVGLLGFRRSSGLDAELEPLIRAPRMNQCQGVKAWKRDYEIAGDGEGGGSLCV